MRLCRRRIFQRDELQCHFLDCPKQNGRASLRIPSQAIRSETTLPGALRSKALQHAAKCSGVLEGLRRQFIRKVQRVRPLLVTPADRIQQSFVERLDERLDLICKFFTRGIRFAAFPRQISSLSHCQRAEEQGDKFADQLWRIWRNLQLPANPRTPHPPAPRLPHGGNSTLKEPGSRPREIVNCGFSTHKGASLAFK